MTDSSASLDQTRRRAAMISLAVGVAMLAIKSTAYLLTGSSAIFSDALESVVHIAATAMAFFSVVLSARPADPSHPYGHGKVEFFSAGIEGALIVLAAIAIIVEALSGIIRGRELVQLDVGLLLTVVASVVNLVLGWFLVRTGRATSSLTLVADGKHVLTDSITSFGVVVGVGLVILTGFSVLDGLVAMAVATNILVSGYRLVRVSIGGLMDESDRETLEAVAAIVERERTEEWINLHEMRVIRSGMTRHVDFHLTIPFYWTVERAHQFHHAVTDRIREGLGNDATVMIHVDPCVPACCIFCRVDPCKQRSAPFRVEPGWEAESLVADAPYVSRKELGKEESVARAT